LLLQKNPKNSKSLRDYRKERRKYQVKGFNAAGS